jgi:hypothetical protein
LEFTKEYCYNKKEQESNLTKQEKEDLMSLKQRLTEGEILIEPTDKSSRFSLMDVETYLQAGLKHAGKDEIVTIDQIKDNQHELNSQVSMLLKIYLVGGNWGHSSRARGNMICSSEIICNMYVLFKDHIKRGSWAQMIAPPPPLNRVKNEISILMRWWITFKVG